MSKFIALSAFLLIPLIVYFCSKQVFDRNLKNVSIAAISAVLMYLFIIGSALYIEYKLDAELTAFDLDNDGFFSGSEVTPDQEKAMQRVIYDTGRTFAPITGAIFSIFYFFLLWLLFSAVSIFKKWQKNSK